MSAGGGVPIVLPRGTRPFDGRFRQRWCRPGWACGPRRPLGCARSLVPHDRVDHLEPFPRHGLQDLVVRHSPVAAARVVVAPLVAAARQAVAREHEQVLASCCPAATRTPTISTCRTAGCAALARSTRLACRGLGSRLCLWI